MGLNERDERIAERIRKLLAIAGNSPSKGEAENAMCKAQELLAQHRLSMKDIETKEEEEPVEETSVFEAARASAWRELLADYIADGFRCRCFYRRNSALRRSRIIFLGREQDIAVARSVFEFACIVAQELARTYASDTSSRNSYLRGFASGVGAMLRQQKESRKEEWGLVLVCDPQVEKAWLDLNIRGSKKAKRIDRGDPAYSEGFYKGLSFNPELAGQVLPAS